MLMAFLVTSVAVAQDIETTGAHRLLSSGNSANSALGGNAVFLGTPVESHTFSWATVTVDTDVPGTMFVEYSSGSVLSPTDPSRVWYSQAYPLNEPVSNRFIFTSRISGSFARVRVENLSTPQAFLRLETIFHTSSINIEPDEYHPIFGPLRTEASLGGQAVLDGVSSQAIWGVDGEEPDWRKSGLVSIVSASTEDNPSGTGMASLLVVGTTTDSFKIGDEFITLNGTTPVLTTQEFHNPITRMIGLTAGSGAADSFGRPVADGNITATIDGASAAVIRADRGDNTSQGVNFVSTSYLSGLPHTIFIKSVTVNVGKTGTPGTGTVSIELFVKPLGGLWIPFSPEQIELTAEPSSKTIPVNLALNPGDLMMCVADADKAVTVSLEAIAKIYGPPLATCTGDCEP